MSAIALALGACVAQSGGPRLAGARRKVAAARPPFASPSARRPRSLAGAAGRAAVAWLRGDVRPASVRAATVRRLGVAEVERRYLVYAPAALPARPVPVVFVFPGYSASAEAAAFYYTHTRWEALADRDGFVVVYGNGLPHPPDARERPAMPKGGFLQGCLAEHAGEGIDVAYVRHIVEQLGTSSRSIERESTRPGGRRAAAWRSSSRWKLRIWSRPSPPSRRCRFNPRGPGCTGAIPGRATNGCRSPCWRPPTIRSFRMRPAARANTRPRATRAWKRRERPGSRRSGSRAHRASTSSPTSCRAIPFSRRPAERAAQIERQRYGPAADGRELWFYKAVGMGHCWPNPIQTWSGLWERFGKTNQDIDFTDEAWAFFQRHARR